MGALTGTQSKNHLNMHQIKTNMEPKVCGREGPLIRSPDNIKRNSRK